MNEIYINKSRYSTKHIDLLLVNREGILMLFPGISTFHLKKWIDNIPYEDWYTRIQEDWSGSPTTRFTIDEVMVMMPLEVCLVLEGGV